MATYLNIERLNSRIEAIAAALTSTLHVCDAATDEIRCAVYLERNSDLVAALVAALKCAVAYVPIDPSLPIGRASRILENSCPAVVITQAKFADAIAHLGIPMLCVENLPERDSSGSVAFVSLDAFPDRSAYLIYTSGTSGEPKGVDIPRSALTNCLSSFKKLLGCKPGDTWLSGTSISFDIAALEILLPILSEGSLVLASAEEARDPQVFLPLIAKYKISHIQATPSMWRLLLAEPSAPDMRGITALCGGEALSADLAQLLWNKELDVWHVYGPTEATIWVSAHKLLPNTRIHLGQPLQNCFFRILDEHRRPVASGHTGQLFIGGSQLAHGYFRNPSLTASRFSQSSVEEDQGARLYATGDAVRFENDGTLSFLGRIDQQVKIRGYRVELEEIELAIRKYTGIADCAVVLRETENSTTQLIAYIVSDPWDQILVSGLRVHLCELLPEYMIPGQFVHIDQLPLTTNGKLDRNWLRTLPLELDRQVEHECICPDEFESVLTEIWAEKLRCPDIHARSDFFMLGGDSLTAIRILYEINKTFGVKIPLKVFRDSPTISSLARAIRGARKVPFSAPPGQHHLARTYSATDSGTSLFPLTDIQQAYLFGRSRVVALGTVSTHRYVELDFEHLDLERLQIAVSNLIRRHPMLRAVFSPEGTQCVLEETPNYVIRSEDLVGADIQTARDKLTEIRDTMSHQVLDATVWPLFDLRVTLTKHFARLHISSDALIRDAWSFRLLLRELAHFYEPCGEPLSEITYSFREYVNAQIQDRTSDGFASARQYWQTRMKTLPKGPMLPLAKKPADVCPQRFTRLERRIRAAEWRALKLRAAFLELTPSAFLLGIYSSLLSYWSEEKPITLNLTFFNRPPIHPDIEQVVGDFTSSILFGINPDSRQGFSDFLSNIQIQLWDDLDHAQYSGVQVLRDMAGAQYAGQSITLPVVFTSLLFPDSSPYPQNFGQPVYAISQTPQIWLDHQVTEDNGELILIFDHVEGLFPKGMLDDVLETYGELLIRLAWNDDAWRQPLFDTISSRFEQIQRSANIPSGAETSTPQLIHQGFLDHARLVPGKVAVRTAMGTVTYGTLDAASNGVAHLLAKSGIAAGSYVAIRFEKGIEQIASVLGVLKAGCAYVPISPDWPAERVQSILKTVHAKALITGPLELTLERTFGDVAVLVPDLLSFDTSPFAAPRSSPTDIAYVIFTSGSTGTPKGVAIQHCAAWNTIQEINARYEIDRDDAVFGISELTFDLSVWDIFGTFLAGGTLVLPNSRQGRDPYHWCDLIKVHSVTVWNSVPALMSMLLEAADGNARLALQKLRLVLLSGDWIPLDMPKRLKTINTDIRVVSLGGATEASIWSIAYEPENVPAECTSIPYGKALAGQFFYVLDDSYRFCPRHLKGSLFIGGNGLSTGYVASPQLNSKKFVLHPTTNEKIYHTGDLGRILSDDNIELLGRDDFQVKIGGFRIELGEIENLLNQHDSISRAVVVCDDSNRYAKQLVAAYIPKTGSTVSRREVREYLARYLPEYMIPQVICDVDAIPLSDNGKLDRLRIISISRKTALVQKPTALENEPLCQNISAIWSDILGFPMRSNDANFFDCGGNSLALLRVHRRIVDELQVELEVTSLFRYTTISSLASFLRTRQPEKIDTVICPVPGGANARSRLGDRLNRKKSLQV